MWPKLMTDTFLLEQAAKAANYETMWRAWNVHDPKDTNVNGFVLYRRDRSNGGTVGSLYPWNPLANDSDAFRLALLLDIKVMRGQAQSLEYDVWEILPDGDDMYAATRRVIVQAAAQIQRLKEKHGYSYSTPTSD